jgi:hypothetical protein
MLLQRCSPFFGVRCVLREINHNETHPKSKKIKGSVPACHKPNTVPNWVGGRRPRAWRMRGRAHARLLLHSCNSTPRPLTGVLTNTSGLPARRLSAAGRRGGVCPALRPSRDGARYERARESLRDAGLLHCRRLAGPPASVLHGGKNALCRRVVAPAPATEHMKELYSRILSYIARREVDVLAATGSDRALEGH